MIDFPGLRRQAGAGPTANPFPHHVFDGVCDPDLLDRARRSFPETAAMTRKPGIPRWSATDRELLGPDGRAVCEALLSPRFAGFVSEVTGTAGLVCDPDGDWGSFRISTRGAVHAAHIGTNVNPDNGWRRRYSLFTYLNPGWHPAAGGLLELWAPGADGPAARIVPEFNRAVLIETTARSLHGVSTVHGHAPRKTITVHFWTRPA